MTEAAKRRIMELAEKRDELLRQLPNQPSGLAWCSEHTQIADEIVQVLFADLLSAHGLNQPISVIATGGYGRRELCPYSDIDITVVPADDGSPAIDSLVRKIFQDLHWAFGSVLRLGVGYSYRLLSDCPGLDANTRTGLLDMRRVAGSEMLFQELQTALVDSFSVGEFLLAKIREREGWLRKFHDSPHVVEPQLKEGAGGLRCFHCANWIREAVGDQRIRPTHSYDAILRYRNLLHFVSGRQLDLLSRPRQAEVADLLGTSVYAMMSKVVEGGASLHYLYRTVRERIHEARFELAPGVFAVRGEARVLATGDSGQAATGIAIATQLGLDVSDLASHSSLPVSGPAAMWAIRSGEDTLRNLDRCGVLQRLLPELDACRFLIPSDSLHEFTVFEHTFRVIRVLDSIEPGTFLGDLKVSLQDLAPLYLAALLHDVGKVKADLDHNEIGAQMAFEVVRRWGLVPEVGDTVVWLIQEHLSMTRVIRIHDIQHADTVSEFALKIKTPERLALLTLLTYADVSAVATAAWTSTQEVFLRELYARTLAILQGHLPDEPDITLTRRRLVRQMKSALQDPQATQQFVESLPSHYLSSTPADIVPLHMEFAKKAALGENSVEVFHRSDLNATDFTVVTLDRHGLLGDLLAVLYAFDLSLMSIRACTTTTDPAIALDVFTVAFGGRQVPAATSRQVVDAIQSVLLGAESSLNILKSRGKDPNRDQQIFRYSYRPGLPGVLEIRAPRGRGMPFRFCRVLSRHGWSIVSARVGQWAGTGAATFYILGPGGTEVSESDVAAALGAVELIHN